ncbi:acyltransferase family protein [Ruegeria arenilitoris]|uniref:acyltransferase family protein n=1 Tax=Ruegeria arenilitoris TaxID=1173585 RepID=UPI00147B46E0|nr:acyltransferase [Ruegeria arenilitoris]
MTDTAELGSDRPISGQPDFNAYQTTRRFSNLDGLRFICIAMVLWHHANPFPDSQTHIFGRGFLGVDFFFVLSGFLITTLLLRESKRYGRFSLRNFYLRRIIRIFPVYFFVVTLVGTYYVVIKGQTGLLGIWPFYYFFLSNFLTEHIPLLGITWSLSVEEQYYMIWPLVLLILPFRLLVPVCIVFVGLNVAIISGLFPFEPISLGPLLFKLPNATYAPIILGSLSAVVLHRQKGFEKLSGFAGGYYASAIGLLSIAVLMVLAPYDLRGWPNLLIHIAMTYTLVALVVREKNILSGILTFPPVARFGVVSYGIYLYHLIALDVVNRISTGLFGGVDPWALLIVYSLLSYLIAEISFRTLEAYFTRFRPKTSGA